MGMRDALRRRIGSRLGGQRAYTATLTAPWLSEGPRSACAGRRGVLGIARPVSATGLGKTSLGAFDSNRTEYKRVLFVAHRDEILMQAMDTFRRIRPDTNIGKYTGTERDQASEMPLFRPLTEIITSSCLIPQSLIPSLWTSSTMQRRRHIATCSITSHQG
jgi:hypothetical protein